MKVLVLLRVNGTRFVAECDDRAAAETKAEEWIAASRKSGFKYAEFHVTYYDATPAGSLMITYDGNGIRHEQPEKKPEA